MAARRHREEGRGAIHDSHLLQAPFGGPVILVGSRRQAMPSPFPGMDPYLEAPRRWLEFHNHLAAELCAALNRTLDSRYVASLTSSITYQAIEISSPRAIQPDVAGLRSTTPPEEAPARAATLALAPVESAI